MIVSGRHDEMSYGTMLIRYRRVLPRVLTDKPAIVPLKEDQADVPSRNKLPLRIDSAAF